MRDLDTPAEGSSPSALTPYYVTPAQAGRLLGLSRTAIYRLLDCGAIESRRLGRRRLVLLSSVHRFARGLSDPLLQKGA